MKRERDAEHEGVGGATGAWTGSMLLLIVNTNAQNAPNCKKADPEKRGILAGIRGRGKVFQDA